MKSIKEMAEEYGIANPNINYDSDGERYDDVKTTALDYMEGANYVLEQIEQLIYEKHIEGNLPLFELTHLIDKLKK